MVQNKNCDFNFTVHFYTPSELRTHITHHMHLSLFGSLMSSIKFVVKQINEKCLYNMCCIDVDTIFPQLPNNLLYTYNHNVSDGQCIFCYAFFWQAQQNNMKHMLYLNKYTVKIATHTHTWSFGYRAHMSIKYSYSFILVCKIGIKNFW